MKRINVELLIKRILKTSLNYFWWSRFAIWNTILFYRHEIKNKHPARAHTAKWDTHLQTCTQLTAWVYEFLLWASIQTEKDEITEVLQTTQVTRSGKKIYSKFKTRNHHLPSNEWQSMTTFVIGIFMPSNVKNPLSFRAFVHKNPFINLTVYGKCYLNDRKKHSNSMKR